MASTPNNPANPAAANPAESTTISQEVEKIFNDAANIRASDIHIEPLPQSLLVRFRVDGEMTEYKQYNKSEEQALIARIKILGGMRIDEHRLPQDGKASFKHGDKDFDMRMSVLPTIHGEKICLRLLAKSLEKIELHDLGFLPNVLSKIQQSLKNTYGMILCVGPTGSGKSTTLFAMISTYDPKKENISTLEDPVEYKIPFVNQSQIHPEIGFDFSEGLRTLVRQDPDIIMVGEIRDKKTGLLGVEAALTGHLVFSTLHTNSAATTIQRLLHLGVDPFLISSALRLIISQRLIRRACQYCRIEETIPEGSKKTVQKEVGQYVHDIKNLKFYHPKGCEKCNFLGYKGRIGVYEVLDVSAKIQEMIVDGRSPAEIETQAISEGMITMRQDALMKVVLGDTTIEEYSKVIT